jgi:hypothetical protein
MIPSEIREVDPAVAMESVRQTLTENGRPPQGMNSFTQARTAHEIAKAHLARLRLQEKKGQLINKDHGQGAGFSAGTRIQGCMGELASPCVVTNGRRTAGG